MRLGLAIVLATVIGLLCGPAWSDDEAGGEDALTLERLFPDKSIFGPSATSMRFSADGAYAAYLYRPRVERRHGNDLFIRETATGETRRITSVSVMSPFQERSREVRDDRIAKAKKRAQGESTGDVAPADADDPVSGTWEGRMTGGELLGLPPDGLTVTLTLELGENGVVEGDLVTLLASAEITDGTWDGEANTLTCALEDPGSGLRARLEAEIADGALEGALSIDGVDGELEINAKRSAAVVSADDDGADTIDDDTEYTGDEVGDDDAGGSGPRYSGVSSYVWSPTANELIFTSEGDLYRWTAADGAITRLTRTTEWEFGVQYLPDGSGYTINRSGALVKVVFGDHIVEQINPSLPGGELMNSYELSPDGRRIVMMTTKGPTTWEAGRMVNIATYRSRFTQVNQVPRHVSDDPLPKTVTSFWLYVPDDAMAEKGVLKKIFEFTATGPRDVLHVPNWSPDSSRVSFAVFEQKSGNVRIMESTIEANEEGADEPFTIADARVAYELHHHGGPTTPRMVEAEYLADSRRIVFLSEQSGYRHLHVLDPLYESLVQLTHGAFEVYPGRMTDDHRFYDVTATKEHPSQQGIYRVDLDSGEMARLSPESGMYSRAAVSPDGKHVLASYVTFGGPTEMVAIDVDAETQTAVTDSHGEEAHALTAFEPDFFEFENRHGHTIHGHMFKPDGWSEDDQRPLLIYVYGGPLGTRKMVVDGSYAPDAYFFALYMAKVHGFVTCTIDPRGVSGYGGLFEKSNFEQVGKPQVEDLVDCAAYFVEHHGVDEKRVALHGWSFGGFQTQMCLYTEPDVFAAGMAGAGPTEWENYNSWYTQGTIGETRQGHPDLAKFSLLPLAKNLEAQLLLVHGMEDANVLYHDTVRVYRELLKAGKETNVELFLDPTGGHGLGGDVKRIGRYRKYESFLLRTVGAWAGDSDDQ